MAGSATRSRNRLVWEVQAADFLADDYAIRMGCSDLSRRMFGHLEGVEGAPASKKRKTKSRASMANKLIQEQRDANEKVRLRVSDVVCRYSSR